MKLDATWKVIRMFEQLVRGYGPSRRQRYEQLIATAKDELRGREASRKWETVRLEGGPRAGESITFAADLFERYVKFGMTIVKGYFAKGIVNDEGEHVYIWWERERA